MISGERKYNFLDFDPQLERMFFLYMGYGERKSVTLFKMRRLPIEKHPVWMLFLIPSFPFSERLERLKCKVNYNEKIKIWNDYLTHYSYDKGYTHIGYTIKEIKTLKV